MWANPRLQSPPPLPSKISSGNPLETEKVLINEIIQAFGELDMKADEESFNQWLSQKQLAAREMLKNASLVSALKAPPASAVAAVTAAVSFANHHHHHNHDSVSPSSNSNPTFNSTITNTTTTATPIQTNTILEASLEHLTNEQVDDLIKKLQKNNNAYKKWILKKEEEAEKQRIMEGKKEKVRLEKETLEKKKEMERKLLINKTIETWEAKKQREMANQEEEGKNREAREKKIQEQREKTSKKSFEEWRQRHSLAREARREELEMRQSQRKALTRPMWISNEAPPWDPIDETTGAKKKREAVVLSPPNMYNDFSLYKKHCDPSFFTKYSVLVASAGIPTSSLTDPAAAAVSTASKVKKVTNLKPNTSPMKPKANGKKIIHSTFSRAAR